MCWKRRNSESWLFVALYFLSAATSWPGLFSAVASFSQTMKKNRKQAKKPPKSCKHTQRTAELVSLVIYFKCKARCLLNTSFLASGVSKGTTNRVHRENTCTRLWNKGSREGVGCGVLTNQKAL